MKTHWLLGLVWVFAPCGCRLRSDQTRIQHGTVTITRPSEPEPVSDDHEQRSLIATWGASSPGMQSDGAAIVYVESGDHDRAKEQAQMEAFAMMAHARGGKEEVIFNPDGTQTIKRTANVRLEGNSLGYRYGQRWVCARLTSQRARVIPDGGTPLARCNSRKLFELVGSLPTGFCFM